jgi:hypothetical protein
MLSEGRPTQEEGRIRNIHVMRRASNPRQGVLSLVYAFNRTVMESENGEVSLLSVLMEEAKRHRSLARIAKLVMRTK